VQQDLAFVFPGQGSQRAGMLAAAAAAFPQVGETFAEASEALGEDLWALVTDGDVAALNLTRNTQPLLLTASVALWRCWLFVGGEQPGGMAGHSLGELSALTCAGALQFADAVRLVRARGQFMQEAVPAGEGAMAAVIGLPAGDVQSVCATVAGHGVVAAVNFNSPHQVVIAGHAGAVAEASRRLVDAGARRVMPLPVSAPFHTELMQPAGERLAAMLAEMPVTAPSVPVFHNVTAAPESDPDTIRRLLVAQVSAPVRWTDCIAALRDAGARRFVECGPGRVLGGLLRRTDTSLDCLYLEGPDDLHAAAAATRGDA
jgi:[acyl-carrier-protein] S-malonyltransferase